MSYKEKTGRKITSVLLSMTTVVFLSGAAAAVIPAVASAQAVTIQQLQAQIAALTAQLAALSGGAAAPAASGAACTFTRSLTVGSRGDDVKCLQGALGVSPMSGYFGPLTKAAVARWQAANGVSPAAGYFGKLSQAKFAASATVGTVPPTPPTTTPPTPPGTTPPPAPVAAGSLSVAAASSQPANSLAPGSATRLPFTKVTVTAGSSDVTVNGITVTRSGLGVDSNFSGVVLLDQDGTQLGTEKTLNSNHQAIVGDTFVVKAGTTRTLTVAGNMAAIATLATTAGQVVGLDVTGVNTSATVSGTLPITGAQQTINGSLTIGSVTMVRSGLDPGTGQTIEVGRTGYTFSAVRVTAGSAEKVYLSSVRWNQTGSAGSGDLANIVTIVNGTSYPTTVSSDGKFYTTVFTDNSGKGITIDKGFSADISIQGDIAGGSGRTVSFDIAKRSDLALLGDLYGYGIKPLQTGTVACTSSTHGAEFCSSEDPWYSSAQVSVSAGTMTVSTSAVVPAQNIAVNVNNQPLGGFVASVKGEAISAGSLVFNFFLASNGAARVADITNISLVDSSGAVLAGPVDGVTVDQTSGTVTFSSSVTFPVGVNNYKLLGKIGTAFPNNATIVASTTPSSSFTTVKGLTTGNTITPSPTSIIAMNTMTVKGAALNISVSSVPIAQNVIANTKGFVFANYILDATASGEDQRMTNLPLAYDANTGGSKTDLSNCSLWDGTTQITTGSNIKNPASTDASNTTFTLDGTGLVVSKGTSKVVSLKCDVSGSAGAASRYAWGFGPNVSAQYTGVTGLTSGQTTNVSVSTSTGQYMTLSAGGTLVVSVDSGSNGSLPYRIVAPGQTVELARLKYSATNEDVNVRQIALQLSSIASNTPTDLVGREIDLWNGTTQVGSAIIGSNNVSATGTLTAFTVPRDSAKILTVKGTIANVSNSGPLTASGDLLKVDYDGNNNGTSGNYGVGAQSGTNVNTTVAASPDTTTNGVRIMKAYPTIANIPLSSSEAVLTAGTQRLYKFSVTSNNGDVSLAKFTFSVGSSTVVATTSKFQLFAYTDSGFSSPDANFSGSNNPNGLLNAGSCYSGLQSNTGRGPSGSAFSGGALVAIYPDTTGCNQASTTLLVPVGTTRWFVLKGSVNQIAPAGTAESLQVQMNGDAAFPVNTTNLLDTVFKATTGVNADANNSLIWSPRSTSTTDSITNLDWTNGFGVSGLPSSGLDIQQISK